MGVTASGKTTVGHALALRLGWVFADADDFHSQQSRAKMQAGIPLDDADRAPWLASLHAQIATWVGNQTHSENAILACSALKQQYRDTLLAGIDSQSVRFVFLDGPASVMQARLAQRKDHYMSPSLLPSQIATLEPPTDALRVSVDQTFPAIVQDIVTGLDLGDYPESQEKIQTDIGQGKIQTDL